MKGRILYCYLVTWVFFLFYSIIAVYTSNNNVSGKIFEKYNVNLFVWMLGLIIFISVLMISNFFLKSKYLKHWGVISFVISCIWILACFFKETDVMPYTANMNIRHVMPTIFSAVFVVAILTLLEILIKNTEKIDKLLFCDLNRGGYCVSKIVIFVSAFCLMFAPNIWRDIGVGKLYHIHAYQNSIINTFYLAPYNDVNASIYGHYGLIYLIPVKILSIFTNVEFAVNICIALIGAATYLMLFLILKKIIRSKVILIISAICTFYPCICMYPNGQYFQVYPQRIFFPILVLMLCICYDEYDKIGKLKYFVGVLSIIWNLETGLVCLITLMGYNVYKTIDVNGWKSIKILYESIKSVVFCIFAFFAAYLLVNVYNIAVGGTWNSIKTFIFPVGSNSYSIDSLILPLNSVFSEWFIFESLFLLGITLAIMFVGKRKNDIIKYIFIISIMGIGLMPYFINRAAIGNISVVYFEVILLIAVFLDYCVRKMSVCEKTEYYFGHMAMLIPMAVMLYEVMFLFPQSLLVRNESVWQINNIEEIADSLENDGIKNESDIIAFGMGVPELFACINKDTNCHIIDWSDMNGESLSYLALQLENAENIFLANMSGAAVISGNISIDESLKVINDMFLVKTYVLPNKEYYLYVKNPKESSIYKTMVFNRFTHIINAYKAHDIAVKYEKEDMVQKYVNGEYDECADMLYTEMKISDEEYMNVMTEILLFRLSEENEKEYNSDYIKNYGRAEWLRKIINSEEFKASISN